MTIQGGTIRDVTLKGALVEHRGRLEAQRPCFLQVGSNGDLSTIRCRVVNTRVNPTQPHEDPSYLTLVECLDLSPAGQQALRTLVDTLETPDGYDTGAP